jgi:D-arabinose 1-dehydrogenase-like Zn-dependent alcohol dehydrogenase
VQVAHCGICHSDLHQVLNEWQNTKYPCMPGHEITGIVTEVGDSVSKFKVHRLSLSYSHWDLCKDQTNDLVQVETTLLNRPT